MRFLHLGDEEKELTYEDVFLVPGKSEVRSRMDVDLSPARNPGITFPVVVSNMNAVAGRRMAETVARRGGLVVLPQDMSPKRIEDVVRYVKGRHHVFETPVVLDRHESIQTALNLIYKRSHGAIVVVDEGNRPVGIFTEKDAYNRDRFALLEDVMTTDLVTVPDTDSPESMYRKLESVRLSIMPVVKSDGTLAGVITKRGALRATMYKPAVNASGELLTAVAIGINRELESWVKKLLEIGVDYFVLDTAHGHQVRMLEAIRTVRGIIGSERQLVAGNIVTKEAAKDFLDAGASILKVGVGPGAMCSTRMATGVGRPQFSAVRAVSEVARASGAAVWADGGVKHPRDVVLALAAGANAVMVGSWFAGTFESPADVKFDERGRLYKENFGMASRRAVRNRNETIDSLERARRELFEEGASQSKMYMKEGQESAEDILDSVSAGLRSACTYMGARSLEEFFDRAVIGVQTQSGYKEGKPVSESWT